MNLLKQIAKRYVEKKTYAPYVITGEDRENYYTVYRDGMHGRILKQLANKEAVDAYHNTREEVYT